MSKAPGGWLGTDIISGCFARNDNREFGFRGDGSGSDASLEIVPLLKRLLIPGEWTAGWLWNRTNIW